MAVPIAASLTSILTGEAYAQSSRISRQVGPFSEYRTNRKPMLWADLGPYENSEQNFIMEDHHAFYRGAIALRREHEALRVGGFETHLTDDEQDLWVFLRTHGEEVLMVALNAGSGTSSFSPPVGDGEWSPLFGDAPEPDEHGSAPMMMVGPIAGRVWRRTAPGH